MKKKKIYWEIILRKMLLKQLMKYVKKIMILKLFSEETHVSYTYLPYFEKDIIVILRFSVNKFCCYFLFLLIYKYL